MSEVLKFNKVEEKIVKIRNQNVLLDSDVAFLYGVETREINQAIKNNPKKFPEGYIVQLNKAEWSNLKSKILTSRWGGKNKLPKAFTEKGCYMLATILKGDQATDATIDIVETFAKIRELSRSVAELAETKEETKRKSLMQRSGEIFADIISDDMAVTDTETSIEINFAVMKFKHTIKQKKN